MFAFTYRFYIKVLEKYLLWCSFIYLLHIQLLLIFNLKFLIKIVWCHHLPHILLWWLLHPHLNLLFQCHLSFDLILWLLDLMDFHLINLVLLFIPWSMNLKHLLIPIIQVKFRHLKSVMVFQMLDLLFEWLFGFSLSLQQLQDEPIIIFSLVSFTNGKFTFHFLCEWSYSLYISCSNMSLHKNPLDPIHFQCFFE